MGTTFWLDLDAEDEPTVWTGDPDRPTAIIRRCQLSGDEATRDEVLRRIVAAGPDPAKVAAEALAWRDRGQIIHDQQARIAQLERECLDREATETDARSQLATTQTNCTCRSAT